MRGAFRLFFLVSAYRTRFEMNWLSIFYIIKHKHIFRTISFKEIEPTYTHTRKQTQKGSNPTANPCFFHHQKVQKPLKILSFDILNISILLQCIAVEWILLLSARMSTIPNLAAPIATTTIFLIIISTTLTISLTQMVSPLTAMRCAVLLSTPSQTDVVLVFYSLTTLLTIDTHPLHLTLSKATSIILIIPITTA